MQIGKCALSFQADDPWKMEDVTCICQSNIDATKLENVLLALEQMILVNLKVVTFICQWNILKSGVDLWVQKSCEHLVVFG